MARPESRYVCGNCGDAFLRWEGQCRTCGTWNSLVETVVREPRRAAGRRATRVGEPAATAQPLAGDRRARSAAPADRHRRARPRPRWRARAGIGDPPGRGARDRQVDAAAPGPRRARRRVRRRGAGRSTRPARNRPPRSASARTGSACSTDQPASASGCSPSTRSAASSRKLAHDPPEVLVVDSVQTATVDELDGPAGSVGQVREATLRLMAYAKDEGAAVILAGHVTKDGTIAGPEDARAPRRCGDQPRGRAVRGAPAPARVEEPLRLHRGGRRLRDGRARVSERSPIRHGPSSPTTTRRRRAASSRRPSRGAGRLLVEVQGLVSAARFGSPDRGERAGSTRTG